MDPATAWRQQAESFGRFLRIQRELAELSLRDLAAMADVSNAYLSQLERGLHQPSVRVLRNIAEALNLSTEQVLAQFGLFDDTDHEPRGSVETAIMDDHRLTGDQKRALLSVYRSYVEAASNPD
jgi:transcriptional regulator with XRE-family HTH domain